MKKLVFALTVLMVAAPGLARVDITVTPSPYPAWSQVVTVGYDATTEDPCLVRAFGLNISVDSGAKIKVAGEYSAKYKIYPGSIDINENGTVDGWGSPVAVQDSNYPGRELGGLDTNGITIEMGSLYVGLPNAPGTSGTILKFSVDKDCNVIITENTARTGVVMEDMGLNVSAVDVNLPGPIYVNLLCKWCSVDVSSGVPGVPDAWLGPEDVGYVMNIIDDYAGTGYYVGPTDPNFDQCCDFSSGIPGTPDGWLGPEDVGFIMNVIDDYSGTGYYVQCPGPIVQ